MPETEGTIQRAISGPFSTSGSFEAEQLDLLWRRCRLLFLTGIAIVGVAAVVDLLVPSPEPPLASSLSEYESLSGPLGHLILLGLGLALVYGVRGSPRYLPAIVYGTIAANIVLLLFSQVTFRPASHPYFGISLLLFLSAAFIPWRPGYQWALAATAAVCFLLLQGILFWTLPELQAFWAERGGAEVARNNAVWGVTKIAITGGASALVSKTLYSLTKTAHRAKRLGNYLIHEEIGKGGMGQVFYAQHSLICRPTAVKVMHQDGRDRGTALARFEREIKLSATLTHPNTITIYEVGRTPDHSLYYAMEYLEGLDLQQLVERHGPVSPARTIHILTQVCGSLEEAHARDIIHRDIKPSNIFLTRRGLLYDYVKVLDFGLAKQIESDASSAISKTGMLFGTPRYIAPETVYGNEQVDGRADLYCLGGVAYWMLTGQPPFPSESSVEVLIDHVKTTPKRPSEVSELLIPAKLEAIVMRLLEKKPGDRYETARELEDALAAVPLDEAWSRDRAEDWWNLHGIIGEHPHDCECFFPADEFDTEDRPSLVVLESSAVGAPGEPA
ncbi:MAG: serine/threonine protein kinase [Gemmatimonadota bacterium]|nr:MAG: serine/threonine protein kinase [Gemmatimonadota bacterium]